MAHLHGKDADFYAGATLAQVKGCQDWEFNWNSAVDDTTGMDSSGYFEGLAGLKDWTITANMAYDNGDTPYTTLAPGTSVSMKCWTALAASKYFTGNGIVSNYRKRASVTDKITYSVEIKGTGAPSFTGMA